MHIVKRGDRVRVQCSRVRMRANGHSKSPPVKVMEFTVGSKEVLAGLSAGVLGMVQGERKRLILQPQEAYGPVKPGLVRDIPRARISKRVTLRVGMRLSTLSTWSGRQRRVRVIEIGPESIKVDGNHLLAGQVVELDLLLISLDSSSQANLSLPQIDVGGES